MLAARLKRPTPYVDKTVYVAGTRCAFPHTSTPRRFSTLSRPALCPALARPHSRGGWKRDRGLKHVVAYSDPAAKHRDVAGLLDDYAFTTIACLDAYEATAALSYFNFARRIGDAMIERFFEAGGGFFDTDKPGDAGAEDSGSARHPPQAVSRFSDSGRKFHGGDCTAAYVRLDPPAGVSRPAEQTIAVLASRAEQFGIFAATYGIAAVHLARPHTQVVVVGSDAGAERFIPRPSEISVSAKPCSDWRAARRFPKIFRLRSQTPFPECPSSSKRKLGRWFAPASVARRRSSTPRNWRHSSEGIGRSQLKQETWQQKRADAAIFALPSAPLMIRATSVARTAQVQLHQGPRNRSWGYKLESAPRPVLDHGRWRGLLSIGHPSSWYPLGDDV